MALTFRTVEDAIREVAKGMSLTNGNGMTPYSNEGIGSLLASTHVLIRDEHEWGELISTYTRTLDGVLGRITQTIEGVPDWKRIRRIYLDSFQTPLPVLSSYTDPLTSTLLLGYLPLPVSEDLQPPTVGRYLVQFYPVANTGQVLFQIEQDFDFGNPDTVVPIDFWLHVWGACMQWAADDGASPAQEVKFTKLFNKRMMQVNARENSRPSFQQPNQLQPNDWWEQDAPYA